MSATSGVIKIPSSLCSRGKVHKSLMNKAKISGLLTPPCLVPTLEGKRLGSPQLVRTVALRFEYIAFSMAKNVP